MNADVLEALNDNAVIVNYDRGEVINTTALDAAMTSGKVRYAGIDADLFKNPETGELSGPMLPYLSLLEKHADKLELLPHAAADTEHVSRVDGAKQAVNQLFDVIQYKKVTNLKGDLPEGYTLSGSKTVNGVGKVTQQNVALIAEQAELLKQMRTITEEMAAFWGAIDATESPERRQALIQKYASQLVMNSNQYSSQMEKMGALGPYTE